MTDEQGQKTLQYPMCVLLVEDSDLLRQIFKAAFSVENQIETASGAKEGWLAYLTKSPDIVFLDIGLPDGNGHDLAHRIKARTPSTFVVMATANDYTEDRQEAWFNDVDGFITKPYDKQQITDLIDRCRENRRKR
ncbi:MAG: response regulator [Alphaproteobacteria bacterium]|nr:response regulator [Alphaproteobacteria bacterium]